MIVKQKIYTPLKMVKGVVNAKQKEGNYFHAKNLRFETHIEDAKGAFVFEKGNDVSFAIPKVTLSYQETAFKYVSNSVQKELKYSAQGIVFPRSSVELDFNDGVTSIDSGPQLIIGYSISRKGLILFTTNSGGFDCIWYVPDTNGVKEIELKYCRNLGFSKYNLIEATSNYENENIDKTYWIDGNSQQRSVNILDPKLADLEINVLDMVGDFKLSQIKVLDTFPGGSHTSGIIQYAYNLYRLNGSQTKISPISELVALDKDIFGGGELNEVVSKTVSIEASDLDGSYTNIKMYAVKYTSYNQSPSISLILDQSIPDSGIVSYYDDGNTLGSISNETFLFLGGELLIPRNMEVKNNRMFLSNYTEKSYDLINNAGINVADGCRSFSFDASGDCRIANSMEKSPSGLQIGVDVRYFDSVNTIPIDSNFSCINVDYNAYRYNKDGGIGGSGDFIKYTLSRSTIADSDFSEKDAKGRFFKDGELYRISIQFYSKYGEVSTPKWIADFVTQQTSQGNLSGYYGNLRVELLPAFYTWLNTVEKEKRPVGYRILRAERNIKDRTILAQGIINGMMAIGVSGSGERYNDYSAEAKDFCHNRAIKIPSMIRTFDDSLCPMYGNSSYKTIARGSQHPESISYRSRYYGHGSEVFKFGDTDDARKNSYQFNKLMQFNCPEIEFDLLSKINTDQLTVIGTLANTANNWWGRSVHISSKNIGSETKTTGTISPFDVKSNVTGVVDVIKGSRYDIQDYGLFGPSGSNDYYDNNQFYREYNGLFTFNKKRFEIYGTPEVSERGQGKRTYKKDSHLSYANTMEALSSDDGNQIDQIESDGLNRVNAWSCRSAFLALGNDFEATEDRKGIEEVFNEMGFVDKKGIMLCEFKVSDVLVYVGGMYGGNSYEDKKRTNYIEIGDYKEINDNQLFIKNPGDTFVANYKFERISRNGVDSTAADTGQLTEIVSFTTETSIDLNRRNDLSLNEWDGKFMPAYEDYKKYNRVYSQEPTLIYRKNNDYNFKAVNTFETSIIATKEKIPNESIDSWTDVLINEQITLDGRYGPINALISFRDQVFAFQDRAIAKISILPRVQISGSDGIAVQLGTGSLFNSYEYINTKSGSVNKWGVIATEQAIYYLDSLNKSFCLISGNEMKNISDEEGFHAEFQKDVNQTWVALDNPILQKGVSIGYDQITKDVYLSLFNESGCITISYNESSKGFSSYYDYDAPIYIFNKKEMLTVSPFNGGLVMKHFEGKHNMFNGILRESVYSLILAPEPNTECLFNNIEYNSITRNESNEEVLHTWEKVRVYNEFQDSGLVELVNRGNIRKKNRQYRITLPRNQNSRDRIRNNWAILELKSLNQARNSVLVNDIILYYSPNYIVVR
jgi:hypothetical protein